MSRAARDRTPALSDTDWVAAGADLLAEEGAQGVQIAALCHRLAVTKGSFYWHFPGVAALLSRILDHWRQRATLDIIERLTDARLEAAQAIAALLSFPRRSTSPRAAGLEPSIRDWARRDAGAARAVEEIDRLRLDFLARNLRDHGLSNWSLSDENVHARAYIAYCLMMGDSILYRSLKAGISDDAYLREAARALGLDNNDPGADPAILPLPTRPEKR